MANRYWVNGSGDWSDDENHWATSSGGSPGIGNLPTLEDNVFIDSNSGLSGETITVDISIELNNITSSTGISYTIIDNGNGYGIDIFGSSTFESGITFNLGGVSFFSQNTGNTITTAGVDLKQVGIYGIGGSFILQDNLIISGNIYFNNGIFDANDHNVTAFSFDFYADTNYTPTVVMGSGTWECKYLNLSEYNSEVVTITPEASTIKLINGDISEENESWFSVNASKTFNNLWSYGAGGCKINNSHTFNDLKIDENVSVQFENNFTQTISSLTATGSAGNLITLNKNNLRGTILTGHIINGGMAYTVNDQLTLLGDSEDAILNVDSVDTEGIITGVSIVSVGTGYNTYSYALSGGSGYNAEYQVDTIQSNTDQFTLSKSSGVVVCDYLNLSNSNATGGATWYAGSHSVDNGNNTGWIFTDPPTGTNTTNFFQFI